MSKKLLKKNKEVFLDFSGANTSDLTSDLFHKVEDPPRGGDFEYEVSKLVVGEFLPTLNGGELGGG